MRPHSAAAVAVCILAASVALPPVPRASAASRDCSTVVLYWHRGDDTTGHTENSRSALRLAVHKGYGLETDLRTTADKKIVLMHDATIQRTTDGTGAVSELTAAQIRSHPLDDGSKVPYLAAALAVLSAHRGSVGMLELKPGAMRLDSLKSLRSQILYRGLSHRVIVYSSDRAELSTWKKIAPTIATSLVPNGREVRWAADKFVPYGGATVRTSEVSRTLAERAHTIGLPLTVWGARSRTTWTTDVSAGAEAFILNRPDEYQAWCNARR